MNDNDAKLCTIPGCTRPQRARGLCGCCHARARRRGELPLSKERPISERFWDKVNRGNPTECWPWVAAKSSTGYGQLCIDGKTRKAHRVAYELQVGPIPVGMQIDHRCFNRCCVNPAHLRAVTHKQNMENHQGARRNSKSGVRGVHQEPNGKWRAQVRHNGNSVCVGSFDTLADAESAVLAARRELYSHNDVDRLERAGIEP